MSESPDTIAYSRFAEKVAEFNALQQKYAALQAAHKTAEAKLESVGAEHEKAIGKLQSQHHAALALSFIPDTEEGNEARSWLQHKYDSLEVADGEEKPAMTEWLKTYKGTKAGALFLQPFEAKKEPEKKAAPPKETATAPPKAKADAGGEDPAHRGRLGGDPPTPAGALSLEDFDKLSDAQIKEMGGIDAVAKRISGY
jgi:hypothetical protein